jgi:hypothetical protein
MHQPIEILLHERTTLYCTVDRLSFDFFVTSLNNNVF